MQWIVEAPKDFKVEKMTGDIEPGAVLSGKIVGTRDKTSWNLDFDVTLPPNGSGCGKSLQRVACDDHRAHHEDSATFVRLPHARLRRSLSAQSGWPVAPPTAPAANYRQVQRELGLARTVVVQPNAYGFDNSCTVDAIRALGPQARGDGDRLFRHDGRGIASAPRCRHPGRALLRAPESICTWDDVPAIAARVASLGWHVQVQADGRDLPQYDALLRALPTDVVIDHNGKFMEPVPPEHPAFQTLLRLLDTGRCLGEVVGAVRNVEDRCAALRGRERARARAGEAQPGAVPVGEQLAASGPQSAARQRGHPRPAARLGSRRGDAPRILVDNPARLYGF